jgi:hypothetical protein
MARTYQYTIQSEQHSCLSLKCLKLSGVAQIKRPLHAWFACGGGSTSHDSSALKQIKRARGTSR